jgi:serine/threonine-protein phosphatase PGAM5
MNRVTLQKTALSAMFAITIAITIFPAGPADAVLPTADQPIRNLYLIRHGEYVKEKDCDEDTCCALDPLGRQQARLVAERLDAMPVVFTSLQASAMARARQTGEIIAAQLPEVPLHVVRDVRECTPTTHRQDIMADLEAGEAEACVEQLTTAWSRLFRPAEGAADQHDIVVCHGNVIRWCVCRALGVDPQAWLGMSIANCSLTIIQVRADGSCKLVAFADSGHIPWAMTTYPGVTVQP